MSAQILRLPNPNSVPADRSRYYTIRLLPDVSEALEQYANESNSKPEIVAAEILRAHLGLSQ